MHDIKTFPLPSPASILAKWPASQNIINNIAATKQEIINILQSKDHRLLVIVGPCSIHDSDAAYEYAKKLRDIAKQYSSSMLIIMRTYFSKPRSGPGWKGMLYDPALNGSDHMTFGLEQARKLLLKINKLGVPCATEFLNMTTPHYLEDLISWSAIGARNATSQYHRELASFLPMPVGFKNALSGDPIYAIKAIKAIAQPHTTFNVSADNQMMIMTSSGNSLGHLILRGTDERPNYTPADIAHYTNLLKKMNIEHKLIIDCSHGNSRKDHTQQLNVLANVLEQYQYGTEAIGGIMLESNLIAGNQNINNHPLTYGQSITDSCIDWEDTCLALKQIHQSVLRRQSV